MGSDYWYALLNMRIRILTMVLLNGKTRTFEQSGNFTLKYLQMNRINTKTSMVVGLRKDNHHSFTLSYSKEGIFSYTQNTLPFRSQKWHRTSEYFSRSIEGVIVGIPLRPKSTCQCGFVLCKRESIIEWPRPQGQSKKSHF